MRKKDMLDRRTENRKRRTKNGKLRTDNGGRVVSCWSSERIGWANWGLDADRQTVLKGIHLLRLYEKRSDEGNRWGQQLSSMLLSTVGFEFRIRAHLDKFSPLSSSTAQQLNSSTVLQFYNFTILQFYSSTTLPSYSTALLYCCITLISLCFHLNQSGIELGLLQTSACTRGVVRRPTFTRRLRRPQQQPKQKQQTRSGA